MEVQTILPGDIAAPVKPIVKGLRAEFKPEDIDVLLANIDKLSPDEVSELTDIVDEMSRRESTQLARDDLIEFAKAMMGDYKVGTHHRLLASLLQDIESGVKDRITVSVAPRHGKSQLTSIFFTAWYLGRNPGHKVMLVSHTTELAVDFGRKVRNLIDTPEYAAIFPDTVLSADSKSAGRWNTTQGGEFFAAGVGSALAGRGAHLLLIDDPHSEQDVLAGNFEVFEKAYQWYTFGARTRLMPGGKVAVIATRWHQSDLIGRMIQDMQRDIEADQYEVFEFPAILETKGPDDTVVEKALWPEFFDLTALKRTKASMPVFQWNAQFMQKPTAEEAAIIKREWWQEWKSDDPPECEYIIMSLDAAAETHNRADYTSLTTWGVWFNEKIDRHCIILINAIKDRYEFPELKRKVLAEYKDVEPDTLIVEKKSAGVAIYQELRRMGIPVQEYTPHRGTGDKVARLNSVSDIVSDKLVYVPQTRWAEDLVEEFAAFPFGAHDDQVDSGVMALMRFRAGGFVRLDSDEAEPVKFFKSRHGRSRYY